MEKKKIEREPDRELSLFQKCWWKWCGFFYFTMIGFAPKWLPAFIFRGLLRHKKYNNCRPVDAFLAIQLSGIAPIIAFVKGIIVFFFAGIFWACAAFLGFLLATPLFVRVMLKIILDFQLFRHRSRQKKTA